MSTESYIKVWVVDMCPQEHCGWFVRADGEKTRCPYHEEVCERVRVQAVPETTAKEEYE